MLFFCFSLQETIPNGYSCVTLLYRQGASCLTVLYRHGASCMTVLYRQGASCMIRRSEKPKIPVWILLRVKFHVFIFR